MALIWLVFQIVIRATGVHEPFPHMVAKAGIFVNLLMFAFNLLPIPPLDGGRVATSLLPDRLAHKFARIEPYGIFIVLLMIPLNLLHFWVTPVMAFGKSLLNVLAFPIKLLLS
jgi:Zn-dependent protease